MTTSARFQRNGELLVLIIIPSSYIPLQAYYSLLSLSLSLSLSPSLSLSLLPQPSDRRRSVASPQALIRDVIICQHGAGGGLKVATVELPAGALIGGRRLTDGS